MYKTVRIREKMMLNMTQYTKEIFSANSLEDLFLSVLSNISSNKKDFKDSIRKNIIQELQNILEENRYLIEINTEKITEGDWNYIENRIPGRRLYNNTKTPASYIIKLYIDFGNYEIDNIISVFMMFIKKRNFQKR